MYTHYEADTKYRRWGGLG